MSGHLDIGLQGELLASTHLEQEGYTILDKNWRYQRAEIDIICTKGDQLVFVEVKSRTSNYLGDPIQAVSRKKQKHIIRAADAYVKSLEEEFEIRFDIIGVVVNQKGHSIDHVEEAFYPTL